MDEIRNDVVGFLHRKHHENLQTRGKLMLFEGFDALLSCDTLELPWKENARNVSCIPPGVYMVIKRFSEKYGWHWHILDVKDRSWILFHSGNYHMDTKGCVLVGNGFSDINNDGYQDVIHSRITMSAMNDALEDYQEFRLYIT